MIDRTVASCRGFTLVEVMVSLAVFSMLSALLFASLQISVSRLDALDNASVEKENHRLVVETLRKILGETQPLVLASGDQRTLQFSGGRGRLEGVMPLPSHRGGPGLYRVTIGAGSGKNRTNVMLTYRPHVGDKLPQPETVILFENSTISFRYFGQTLDRDLNSWVRNWIGQRKLPRLIEYTLGGESASGLSETHTVPIRLQFGPRQPQWTLADDA